MVTQHQARRQAAIRERQRRIRERVGGGVPVLYTDIPTFRVPIPEACPFLAPADMSLDSLAPRLETIDCWIGDYTTAWHNEHALGRWVGRAGLWVVWLLTDARYHDIVRWKEAAE